MEPSWNHVLLELLPWSCMPSAAALFEIRGAAEVTVATTEAPPSFNMYLKLKGLKEAEVSGYTCTGDEVSRVPYDTQPPLEASTSAGLENAIYLCRSLRANAVEMYGFLLESG